MSVKCQPSATWRFQIRFPGKSAISEVFPPASADFDATLNRMYEGRTTDDRERGLSEIQRETLAMAHGHGYYDIPRGITQEALADELAVSRQALSERLRRAHDHVIASWLFETAGGTWSDDAGDDGVDAPATPD